MSDAAQYDLVVVGAGVAGALTAKHLTRAGFRVLVLEAGPGTAKDLVGYTGHLGTFYTATGKGPESAWPPSPNAPQPDTSTLRENNGYFIQAGPDLYGSTYSRTRGGSTLHWLGVSLRMLQEDFRLKTRYGVGRDWPQAVTYQALRPYYQKAEWEIGVSADAAEQQYLGHEFPDGYDYPMRRVPPSYSDVRLGAAVDGMRVTFGDASAEIRVRVYPAARNSVPRAGYTPVGMADVRDDGEVVERYLGQRCNGNTACTPICPVQAKYNAGKTLAQCDRDKLRLLSQAVASRVEVDPETGRVTGIAYQQYDETGHVERRATARLYVLAAHAVENAKLMLVSGLGGRNGLVGTTLMDHPALYAWGLAPEPVGAYRGPLSTSGIEDLRAGPFRARHAAFRFDIGNDGWKATTGAPDTAVADAVLNKRLYGRGLREHLADTLPRHVRFSLAVEQLPDRDNRVTIDPDRRDPLGIPRPVVHYRIDDYTKAGMAAATEVAKQVFDRAGIADRTDPATGAWFPSVQYNGTTFHYHGMGHFSGTHAMGDDPATSVVDHRQRCWEHPNLYLVGAGSMPTMGTSNPTLTLAALAIRTAEHLVAELKSCESKS